MATDKSESYYAKSVGEAEVAVAAVKDADLKKAAFGKVLDRNLRNYLAGVPNC
jgi:hypothetical protein